MRNGSTDFNGNFALATSMVSVVSDPQPVPAMVLVGRSEATPHRTQRLWAGRCDAVSDAADRRFLFYN